MFDRFFSLFFFLFCITCLSCSKEVSYTPQKEDYQWMAEWFDSLCSPSNGGRFSGSSGIDKSREYLCNVIDAGEDSLSISSFFFGELQLNNIIFHIKGITDSTLVFGAHYDAYGYKTKSNLPGADDNISGVAVLLCLINRLKAINLPPQRSIDVCFWDGEEIGFLGSTYYVSTVNKPIVYINVDTVGNEEYYDLTLSFNPDFNSIPFEILSLADDLSIQIVPYNPVGFTTDCDPFLRRSLPFYNICCDRIPPYLHKKQDDISNISFDRIVKIANAVFENLIKY